MHNRRHDIQRCIVRGGGISVYDTLTDGTVVWTVCNLHLGAFNTKQMFTTSGTFVAPVSGTYRIVLQGGGGGGGGMGGGTSSWAITNRNGKNGGGGAGGNIENLGDFTAGAGGAGGDGYITFEYCDV